MAGFLLFLAWAIQCGWGIAQHFRVWKWNMQADEVILCGLGADEWLAHPSHCRHAETLLENSGMAEAALFL